LAAFAALEAAFFARAGAAAALGAAAFERRWVTRFAARGAPEPR
jgi:hypothetical protein